MEPGPMEVDGDGEENIIETRLSAISLKAALKATRQQFRTQDPLDNLGSARILWQVACKEIPRIHGEAGRRVVHFMEIMSYVGDDEYKYVTQRPNPDIQETLSIARTWGLLKLSDIFDFDERYLLGGRSTIYFHSLVLMQAIVQESKSKDRELDLLNDCLSSGFRFSYKNHHSIWGVALNYEDGDLFGHLTWTIEDWKMQPRDHDQELLDKIIRHMEVVFGKFHARTMTVKSFNAEQMLTNKETSLATKWKNWNEAGGFKLALAKFLRARRGNSDSEEEENDTSTNVADGNVIIGADNSERDFFIEDRPWPWYCKPALLEVVRALLNFFMNPRPRPEYEEKFLEEGIQVGLKLLFFSLIDLLFDAAEILSTMLSCAEELGKADSVPGILNQWLETMDEWPYVFMYNQYVYHETSPELEGIATCLRFAAALTTSPTTRLKILIDLLPIIEFYDRDIRARTQHFMIESGRNVTTMSRLLLFLVQCLEGLEEYDEVVQTVQQTKEFRDYCTEEVGGAAKRYVEEVDQVLRRCPRVLRSHTRARKAIGSSSS